MSEFKIKQKLNWGHNDSNIELEVTAYVTGHGQPVEGGPNPFVPYPVPRPYPKPKSAHDVKLTPRGLKEGGEIRFVTKAKYKLYRGKSAPGVLDGKVPELKYNGTVQYTHTFKYHFADSGDSVIDGDDLIIDDEPVPNLDEKSSGQHAIKLSFRFDKRDGSNRGPKYVTMIPFVEYLTSSYSSGESSSKTAGRGIDIKVPDWIKKRSPIPIPDIKGEGSYTWGSESGESTNLPTPEDPFGAFTLNLIVPRIEFPVPKTVSAPPLPTLVRLSFLTVGFAEKQANVDAKIYAAIAAWRQKLEQYSPAIIQALKDKKISVYFEGYASKTGSDLFNHHLSDARAKNVKGYVVSMLGVPPERADSVTAHGELKAEWKVEVDRQLREVFKPRKEDRAVVVWMKYEELVAALRGGK